MCLFEELQSIGSNMFMKNVFIYIMAFLITFPFSITWIIYQLSYMLTKSRLKSLHISVHWSTIWYFFAVLVLNKMYLDRFFGDIIILILLFLLSCIIIYQWRTDMDVQIQRAFKILLRFSFFMFCFIYFCFFFYDISQFIFR